MNRFKNWSKDRIINYKCSLMLQREFNESTDEFLNRRTDIKEKLKQLDNALNGG